MNVTPERATAYLEAEAVAQYADRLSAEGWDVQREVQVGKGRADLVATRDDEKVVYEFKAQVPGRRDPDWVSAAMQARKYAQEIGASFRVVAVQPPKPTQVRIEGIEQAVLDAVRDDPPSELIEMSADTRVEDVSDVSIAALRIDGTSMEVEGEAVVSVTLSAGDGTNVGSAHLPFTFAGTIELEGVPAITLDHAIVDTTPWFGDEAA